MGTRSKRTPDKPRSFSQRLRREDRSVGHPAAAFQQWAVGKRVWVALFAREAAATAEHAADLIAFLQSGKSGKMIGTSPPLQRWLELYRNHDRIFDVMAEAIRPKRFWRRFGCGSPTNLWRCLASDLLKFDKMTPAEKKRCVESQDPEELRENVKFGRDLASAALTYQNLDLADGAHTEQYLRCGRIDRVMKSEEAAFFYRVMMPCWMLYGESATRIFARARRGDRKALEQLLTVDKSVAFEPRIEEILHRSVQDDPELYKLLLAAMGRKCPKLSRKQVKRDFAGLISRVARAGNEELTAPQVRDLFDAVESGRTGKVGAIDSDFPESDEGMAKVIQRHRTVWKHIPTSDPDKKSA